VPSTALGRVENCRVVNPSGGVIADDKTKPVVRSSGVAAPRRGNRVDECAATSEKRWSLALTGLTRIHRYD
jgi:hypothetical protein